MYFHWILAALERAGSIAAAAISIKSATQPISTIHLCLAPVLHDGIDLIHGRLSTQVAPVQAGSRFMFMPFVLYNIPLSNYSLLNPIRVCDELGQIPIWYEDNYDLDIPSRIWYANRSSSGNLDVFFTAYPGDDAHTGSGGRIDLRVDQGGFIGNLRTLLPIPDSWDLTSEVDFRLQWNTSKTPIGTKGTWVWGDGEISSYTGLLSNIIASTIAVGPYLKNTTETVSVRPGHSETFSMYWMGDAPFPEEALFDNLVTLFAGMASFFNDTLDFYKIFIRRSTAGSFGGSSFYRTFVAEWYSDMEWSEQDFILLLSHEMVHNWPKLSYCHPGDVMASIEFSGGTQHCQGLPSGSECGVSPTIDQHPSDTSSQHTLMVVHPDIPCTNATTFYNEGIAVYYGLFLPYKFGIIDRSVFLEELNAAIQQYYTSPVIHTSDEWLSQHSWAGFDYVRLPYYRGFTYLLNLDSQLRTATSNTITLQNISLSLMQRDTLHQPNSIHTFLTLLLQYIPTALTDYDKMANGSNLIIPTPTSLSHLNLTLIRTSQPKFEPGFQMARNASISHDTIHTTYIKAIKPGSRAEELGVCVGDVVMKMTNWNWLAARVDREMILVVMRRVKDAGRWKRCSDVYRGDDEHGGVVVYLRFVILPRSKQLSEAYEWVEVE